MPGQALVARQRRATKQKPCQLQPARRSRPNIVKLFAASPQRSLDAQSTRDATRPIPGLIVRYVPGGSIYDDPLLLLDLTRSSGRCSHASTVSADGKLFGTTRSSLSLTSDVSTVQLSAARKQGRASTKRWTRALADTTKISFCPRTGCFGGSPPASTPMATSPTNYAGLNFYRDLHQEVHVGDRIVPAMRSAGLLERAERRYSHSDFFTAFITPTGTRRLNPMSMALPVSGTVATIVRSRCPRNLTASRRTRRRLNKSSSGGSRRNCRPFVAKLTVRIRSLGNRSALPRPTFDRENPPMSAGTTTRPIPAIFQSRSVFGLQIGWGSSGRDTGSRVQELPATAGDAFRRTPLS